MPTDLTDERLAEIEARAEKATPGPWSRVEIKGYCFDEVHSPNGYLVTVEPQVDDSRSSQFMADSAFIAHARTDVPDLAAALRAARAEVERLREAGGFMLGWHPTDINHPAFDLTQEYGTALMNLILSDVSFDDADVAALAERYAKDMRRARNAD